MMGFFQTMLGGGPRAVDPSPDWPPGDDRWYTSVGSPSVAGPRVTPDLSMKLSAVYGCVTILSKIIASLPLRIYKLDAKRKNSVEALDHPLNDLLEHQPNRWQTAWDFKSMMQAHLSLRGNAYAEIIPGPRGFADRLEPLHPDRVKVDRLDDGTIRYELQESPPKKNRMLLQDEMLHIRSPIAPGLVGIGPMEYARETVGLAMAAEENGSRLFSNGARPSGSITIPKQWSKEAYERFVSDIKNNFAGNRNAHRTMILEEGATFKEISMTMEDAQFLQTREFQIDEIARWFGLPPVMIGHMTKQSSWGTGVETVMIAFVRQTLVPLMAAWQQAIRRDLILIPNLYEARFDYESLQRGDSKAQAEFFSKLVLTGILDRNEARQELGYGPRPDLDKPLVPTNMTTTDNMPIHTGEDVAETSSGDEKEPEDEEKAPASP